MLQKSVNLFGVILVLTSVALATPVKNIATSPAPKKDTSLLEFSNQQSRLRARLAARTTLSQYDAFPMDETGRKVEYDYRPNYQLRVGADYKHTFAKYYFLEAFYEHDLFTGFDQAVSQSELLERDDRFDAGRSELRKAKLNLRLGPIALAGGLDTSHWGLGLLANDGAHGWRPGNAYFTDPRSGDRVLRGSLVIGPFTPFRIAISLAYDSVIDDDILLEGDEAEQFIGALLVNPGGARTGGIYVAHRMQKNYTGDDTVVTAVDVYGKWTQEIGAQGLELTAELESATIIGKTGLAPSPEFTEHNILQFGVASRVSLNSTKWGLVTDFLYASGDQNFDDEQINNFRADPNFEMGQLIFRQAVNTLSARAPVTAADPELVGRPNADLDRIPNQGAVTNTLAMFPRVWYSPVSSLHLYGGPLFAFAGVPLADPLNTRTGGGTPHNAFDAQAGRYLGAELNFGLRYTPRLGPAMFLVGAEVAHFTPGSAFEDDAGNRPDPITGGRIIIGGSL
ncbi:MAG: hypothetical protein ACON3Z_01140 [Bradymonadia bacterium]